MSFACLARPPHLPEETVDRLPEDIAAVAAENRFRVELEAAEMAAADGDHLVAAGQIVVSDSTVVSPIFAAKVL